MPIRSHVVIDYSGCSTYNYVHFRSNQFYFSNLFNCHTKQQRNDLFVCCLLIFLTVLCCFLSVKSKPAQLLGGLSGSVPTCALDPVCICDEPEIKSLLEIKALCVCVGGILCISIFTGFRSSDFPTWC